MSVRFRNLFQPIRLGELELKNRIVMAPMVTNYSDNGFVTEQIKEYYSARARGGVGMVIVEACCVEAPAGQISRGQLRIDDDGFIAGLSELATAVKQNGARIMLQLHHAGSQTTSGITGVQPVGPSQIPLPAPGSEMPRELSTEEVGALVLRFAEAALRTQKAGFDGVEIHGGHFYLVAQFLSSYLNNRSDAYGGDIEGRSRFLMEILRATRALVGGRYPVLCRIDSCNPLAELDSTEAQKIAQMAQDAGADAIDASVFLMMFASAPLTDPAGNLVHYVEAVKNAITIPLMGGGGLQFSTAERIIGEGKVDMVAFGRPLLADPELADKLASGKSDEIRPCIACMTCVDCVLNQECGIKIHDNPLKCAVNPAVGREPECAVQRADTPKKVFVVGGGPAGMEVARVSALRGHQVALSDKGQKLGGQLLLASVPPHKEAIEVFADYQRTQLSKLGVNVRRGEEIDSGLVEKAEPDVVILATGARSAAPQIPGINGPNVVSALDVLAGEADTGDNIAVIGAELVACETADFLAENGKKVTLMRRGEEVATKMAWPVRGLLLGGLSGKSVTMLTGVRYEEINDQGVVITTKDGEKQVVEADTVVVAAGSSPNIELRNSLEGKVPELYFVGDCVAPRNIMFAMADGFFTGLKV